MRRKKWHSVLGRIVLSLLAIATGFLLVSAVRSKEEKMCTAIDIKIGVTQQKGFVDENEVKRQIKDALHGKPEGMPIKKFDLNATELILEQNVWIKNAQLFFDNNEILHVQVEQRCPVVRLIEAKGSSFYLDSTGYKLPLSDYDRANVPVFTNAPSKLSLAQRGDVISIANQISADTFLLAQIAQINIMPGGKYEMYPSFGEHVVELGDASNIADKLSRLKAFYKTILVRKGFNAYPKINLAYAKQVLVEKPGVGEQLVDGNRAIQVFDQMVRSNRRAVNEDAEKIEKKPIAASIVAAENQNVHDIKDKPPDVKNKGNPRAPEEKAEKKDAVPKAIMQKPIITKNTKTYEP